ncbi:hypothetical protein GF314_10380 [bacterium]|nr:hypothetical protein [bacterium]
MIPGSWTLGRLKRELREKLERWRVADLERRARLLSSRPRDGTRLIAFPAAGVGSLGDEAMLMASGQVMRRRGLERLTILSYGQGEPWPAVGEFDDVVSLGNRYSQDFWSTCEDLLELCASATHLLIQGADVMDGYYSPNECVRRTTYARIAAAAGLDTTIGGFSFNDRPHPRSVRSLAAVPETARLIARDPVSWRRLTNRLTRKIHAGADMAFLLEPPAEHPLLSQLDPWLRDQRAAGRTLLGVNANYLVAAGHREADVGTQLVRAYIEGLAPLVLGAERVSLVLVPHDYRQMAGRWDDTCLLREIANGLPPEAAPHVRLIDERPDAAVVKALVGRLEMIVSGRMHLAIAALDQGVPAAGVTYQGKFEGLYEHFGISGLCLDPDALTAGKLTSFLREFLPRREELRDAVKRQLPRVRDLAHLNFANLDPHV